MSTKTPITYDTEQSTLETRLRRSSKSKHPRYGDVVSAAEWQVGVRGSWKALVCTRKVKQTVLSAGMKVMTTCGCSERGSFRHPSRSHYRPIGTTRRSKRSICSRDSEDNVVVRDTFRSLRSVRVFRVERLTVTVRFFFFSFSVRFAVSGFRFDLN